MALKAAVASGNGPRTAWRTGWRIIVFPQPVADGAMATYPGSQAVLFRADNEADAYADVWSRNITAGDDHHIPMGVKETTVSATPTPGAVEAIAALPAPVLVASAAAAPGALAALTTAPPASILLTAAAVPSAVAAIAAAPAPVTLASAVATAAVVGVIGAVPASDVTIGATAHPSTVEGTDDIPAPDISTISGDIDVPVGVIAAVAALPPCTIPTYGGWEMGSSEAWPASAGSGWPVSTSAEWEG